MNNNRKHLSDFFSRWLTGPVKVAFLDVGAFERLCGPCVGVMRRNIANYEKRLKELGVSNVDLR